MAESIAQADDARLRTMVQRIVDAVHPDRIVLFGSRARGDAGPDSDYDLMVIGPKDGHGREATGSLYNVIGSVKASVDILWHTREEAEVWRDVASHIVTTALREGRAAYDAVPEWTPSAGGIPAKGPADLATSYLRIAANRLRGAEVICAGTEAMEHVCFHAAEAVAASLKALLAADDTVYRWTHDLGRLLGLVAPRFPALSQWEQAMLSLNRHEVAYKYCQLVDAGEDEARSALETARAVYQFAEATLAEQATPEDNAAS